MSFAVVPIMYIHARSIRLRSKNIAAPLTEMHIGNLIPHPPPSPYQHSHSPDMIYSEHSSPKSPSVREQFILELQRIRPGESLFPHGTEEHAPQRRRGFPPPRVGVVPPPHHDRHRSHRPRAGRVDERIVRDGGDDDRRKVAR